MEKNHQKHLANEKIKDFESQWDFEEWFVRKFCQIPVFIIQLPVFPENVTFLQRIN